MLKRSFDAIAAATGLLVLSPLLGVLCLLIWRQDFHSPVYRAPRVRSRGVCFPMFKLRSMVVNAAAIGGTSTAGDDRRITRLGRMLRRFKFDEIPQLWNVLRGDMSLVGPRPQAARDAGLYTEAEWRILHARPGITDFASIVFADEGEILRGRENPDLQYQQFIRPWKSRLGLLYVERRTFRIDLMLIGITVIGLWSRRRALQAVAELLQALGAEEDLVRVARRQSPLVACAPPGATIIESRY